MIDAAMIVLVPALIAFGIVPAIVYLRGRTLPPTHVASARVYLPAAPDVVFALLADVRAIRRWRKTVRAIDVIATEPRVHFRERGPQGALELEIEEAVPTSKVVFRTAAARDMAFEGTWTYDIEPDGEQTCVTLTERGTIRSPFARVFAAYVLGHRAHVDRTLAALARHFRR